MTLSQLIHHMINCVGFHWLINLIQLTHLFTMWDNNTDYLCNAFI